MIRRSRPRTCAGCGEESPKRNLLRIVRSPEGEVRYDPTGRAAGRGVYVCAREECIRRAQKRNALSRMLKVAVSPDLYRILLEQVLRPGASDGGSAEEVLP